ncbi:MAG: glutaredoxin family protein [Christensenellales bacterium]|jgi:thioredoxin 1
MQKLLMFYMATCPHCKRAFAYEEELKKRRPELASVEVERIDEREEPELADKYDYWYVPTYFMGEERLFSGSPTPEDIERVFDRAYNA